MAAKATPAVDAANTTIDALLQYMKRRRLLWELHLATVVKTTSGQSLGLILDGDTGVVTGQSVLGAVAQGERVVVVYVPPAGYYVVGYVGTPGVAGNENFGTVSITPSAANTPTSVTVTYNALAGNGGVIPVVAANTSLPGATGVTMVSYTSPTATSTAFWLVRVNTTATFVGYHIKRLP